MIWRCWITRFWGVGERHGEKCRRVKERMPVSSIHGGEGS